MKPGQKPPVTRAHTKASRNDKSTPANDVAFARLARQAKNAQRRTAAADHGPSDSGPYGSDAAS